MINGALLFARTQGQATQAVSTLQPVVSCLFSGPPLGGLSASSSVLLVKGEILLSGGLSVVNGATLNTAPVGRDAM